MSDYLVNVFVLLASISLVLANVNVSEDQNSFEKTDSVQTQHFFDFSLSELYDRLIGKNDDENISERKLESNDSKGVFSNEQKTGSPKVENGSNVTEIFSDFSLSELYDLLLEKYADNKSEKKPQSNDSKELERNYGKIEKMIDTSKNGTNELASLFENFFDFLKDENNNKTEKKLGIIDSKEVLSDDQKADKVENGTNLIENIFERFFDYVKEEIDKNQSSMKSSKEEDGSEESEEEKETNMTSLYKQNHSANKQQTSLFNNACKISITKQTFFYYKYIFFMFFLTLYF